MSNPENCAWSKKRKQFLSNKTSSEGWRNTKKIFLRLTTYTMSLVGYIQCFYFVAQCLYVHFLEEKKKSQSSLMPCHYGILFSLYTLLSALSKPKLERRFYNRILSKVEWCSDTICCWVRFCSKTILNSRIREAVEFSLKVLLLEYFSPR